MQGKHTAIVHRAPWGRKAYMQWGAAWFPKGIVNNTAMDLWEADSPPQVGLQIFVPLSAGHPVVAI